jgi:hypothetical protein
MRRVAALTLDACHAEASLIALPARLVAFFCARNELWAVALESAVHAPSQPAFRRAMDISA